MNMKSGRPYRIKLPANTHGIVGLLVYDREGSSVVLTNHDTANDIQTCLGERIDYHEGDNASADLYHLARQVEMDIAARFKLMLHFHESVSPETSLPRMLSAYVKSFERAKSI